MKTLDDKTRQAAALDALNRELDEMFARMNTTTAQKAVEAIFQASPEELGQAAVDACRSDRRNR